MSVLKTIADSKINTPVSFFIASRIFMILAAAGTIYLAFTLPNFDLVNLAILIMGLWVLCIVVPEIMKAMKWYKGT